jgi:small subunit ribosomal protein S11
MADSIEKTADVEDESPAAAAAPKAKKGKKAKVQVKRARIFVKSTYNNTIITIADLNGNVVGWGSAGKTGFKGSRKSTPYAAQRTMEDTMMRLKAVGIEEADVVVKGVGIGRESAIRALVSSGINVLTIKDKTPIPHGGVRPKKARRV